MAWIQELDNGKTFKVRQKTGRGDEEWTETVHRRRDAQRIKRQFEADHDADVRINRHDPTTVVQFARAWLAVQPHFTAASVRAVANVIRRLEADPLGSVRLVRIRTGDVRAWRARMIAEGAGRIVDQFLHAVAAGDDHRRTGTTGCCATP